MGAGQSDLYKGTYGDREENIPEELKGRIRLPENDSQLKHIFRKSPGHLEDTPENRRLLLELANDEQYHAGKDIHGVDWNYKDMGDGSQLWVRSLNGKFQNGGLNRPPHLWDEMTGLSRDITKEGKQK